MVIFPTHGLPCHVCARPSAWFVDGVSLPCRCGALGRDHLSQVIQAVRDYRPSTVRKAMPAQLPEDADVWQEIAAALIDITKELARR